MKEIAIYIEGGGNTAAERSELRTGIDGLLRNQKQAVQAKRLRWRTVPSGGRRQTYEAFIHELEQAVDSTLCVLLVDAEEELPAELPKPKNETPDAKKERLRTDAQNRKNHLANRKERHALNG